MPSNGSFWYGKCINFPGFLYKKNNGVGVKRSTQFTPGGNTICNQPTYLYNRYIPGSGVGASNISVRRHKKILASNCCDNPLGYPKPPAYTNTFVYSFTYNGQLPLVYNSQQPYLQQQQPQQKSQMYFNKNKTLSNNNTQLINNIRNASMYNLLKPYIPISIKDNLLQYSYSVIMNENNFVIVTVDYLFNDNGVTTDGLQFTLDNKYSLQKFYNENTTGLTINKFGSIPLSRNSTVFQFVTGSQFSELNINFMASDVPTILTNTSLSYSFSNFYENANFASDISNWNTGEAIDMSFMFYQGYIFSSDLSTWNVSKVTNMNYMFFYCFYFASDVSNWNVSSVKYMSNMFTAAKVFNSDVSKWNVSSVTDMSSMFNGSYIFNSDISKWNVSNVTDMSNMFNMNYSDVFVGINDPNVNPTQLGYKPDVYIKIKGVFNSDISNWNVSKVKNMSYMFIGADSFNSDISEWNVSSLENMSYMFCYAVLFNSVILNWNVSKVKDMSFMFYGATVFNTSIANWDVSNVENMSSMFYGATSFNSEIFNLNINSKVKNLSSMFLKAESFNSDISNWNVSTVENMSYMFYGQYNSAFNQDLSLWDTSSVTDMSYMFHNAYSYNSDMSKWDTSKVTNMSNMFYMGRGKNDYTFLLGISNWNTSSVTDMSGMFISKYSAPGYIGFNTDLSNWDVSNVTDMSNMFAGAIVFNSDISGWNVSKVTNMSGLFQSAHAFNSDISNWDVSNVTDMSYMFYFNRNQTRFDQEPYPPYVADFSKWVLQKDIDITSMFAGTGGFNITLKNVNSYNIRQVFSGAENCIGDCSGWYSDDMINKYPDSFALNVLNSVIGSVQNFNCNLSDWNYYKKPVSLYQFFGGNINGLGECGIGSWNIQINDISFLFYYSRNITCDLSGWANQFTNLTNMNSMFLGSNSINCNFSGWDISNVATMANIFNLSRNVTSDFSNWNTKNVTNMSNMFNGATNFNGIGLDTWDTSNVTNMSYLFSNTTNLNYAFLNNWNTSNVTNISGLFASSDNFSCNLSNWDISSVTNMSNMFGSTNPYDIIPMTNFNGIGLDTWNTSNVTDMSYLFSSTTDFNYDFVNNWNISKVTNMSGLFHQVTSFLLILTWDTTNVNNMSYMFAGSQSFNNTFVTNWNTANVIDMSYLFEGSVNFSCDLTNWITNSVTNMSYMFSAIFFVPVINFNGTGLDTWDTSKVTNMSGLFFGADDSSNYDFVSNWITTNVTDMSSLFAASNNFSSSNPDIVSLWNTSNVKTMARLFAGTNVSVNLSNWDTSSVTDMSYLLEAGGNFKFTNTTISNWNTSNVENMTGIFSQVTGEGIQVDLSKWDVSKVTNMSYMFSFCSQTIEGVSPFETTGLENWKTDSLIDFSNVFESASFFDATFTKNWNIKNVETMEGMFGPGLNPLEPPIGTYAIKIDVSNWKTTNLKNLSNFMYGLDMRSMDSTDPLSEIIGLENFNTSKVTTLENAFRRASFIDGKFMRNWDLKNVTTMAYMGSITYNEQYVFTSIFNPDLTLSAPYLYNLVDASYAFTNAKSFEGIGLSLLNAPNLVNATKMLAGCSELSLVGANLTLTNTPQLELAEGMGLASKIGGAISMANKKMKLKKALVQKIKLQPPD